MLCPYCNKKMEAGILIGGQRPPRMKWTNLTDYRDPLNPKNILHTDYLVGKYDINELNGYRCFDCNKIIFDIEGKSRDI